jgi:methionine aminopeptidase
VKIQLGAHIDGFAAISSETIVVGASASNPVTGRRADVVKAAWTAAEAAMRTLKVGNKNWAITEIVARSAAQFDCKPVEGALFIFLLFQVFLMFGNSPKGCFLANRHKT